MAPPSAVSALARVPKGKLGPAVTRYLEATLGGSQITRAHAVGVAKSTLDKWAAGKSEPGGRHLIAAAIAAGVTVPELVRGAIDAYDTVERDTLPAHVEPVSNGGMGMIREPHQLTEGAGDMDQKMRNALVVLIERLHSSKLDKAAALLTALNVEEPADARRGLRHSGTHGHGP
jgi:transcriptional regulator with XRE-family HTH domain